MEIAKNTVVAIDYTLKDDDGKVMDSSQGRGPLYYLQGAGNIVPGLEKALAGKSVGDSLQVVIEPKDAYGERDESRTFEVPMGELQLDAPPQKGMRLTMQGPGGMSVPVRILKVKLRSVVMDGNHELAGKRLHFDVEVRKIRKAKKDEIAHGHAHAPGHKHH